MVVRLADVATEAGVSPATASRVLNGSVRTPAEGIAERVKRAAEKLGYFPNAQAQALARSSAGLVGLIVHDIADPYFSTIARGVQHALKGAGRQVLLSSTDRDGEVELDAVRAFMSYRTDGIVLAGSRSLDGDEELVAAIGRYTENGGRVAMIGQSLPGAGAVPIDNHGGAAALVRALAGLGHRRFAVLGGEPALATAHERAEGFLSGLHASGIEPLAVIHSGFTRDGGHDGMLELLDRHAGVLEGGQVCVLAANDVMALGALTAIRERGLRVPEDVAVSGFDDIPTLVDMVPAVTTVRLPLEEMGRRAAELLLAGDEHDGGVPIGGEPILRESTRHVP